MHPSSRRHLGRWRSCSFCYLAENRNVGTSPRCSTVPSARLLATGGPLSKSQVQRLRRQTHRVIETVSRQDTSVKQDFTPTSQHCYRLLEKWWHLTQKTRDISMARHAKELFDALRNHGPNSPLAPTTHFFDLVLQALAVCDPEQAQEFLLSETDISLTTTKSFNIVIHAWAKSRRPHAGSQTEQLYAILEQRHVEHLTSRGQKKASPWEPKPPTLTGVLEAWGSSRDPTAFDRIHTITQHAISKLSRDGPTADGQLDVVVFNTSIRSLANTGGRQRRRAAEACEQLLQTMNESSTESFLQPNTQTYSLVLHAWAKCESQESTGEAASRAEAILQNMMDRFAQGSNVKPNTRSFTSCIAAWSRCHHPQAPQRAQALLDRLVQLYQQTEDPDFRPDIVAGNAVLNAWSRSGAVAQTQQAMQQIQQYTQLDLISYNSLLHAYSQEGNAVAALELLQWLEEESDLVPDTVSFNSVLNALAQSQDTDALETAKKLINQMLRLNESKRRNLKPTMISFTLLTRMLGKSNVNIYSEVNQLFQQVQSIGDTDQLFLVSLIRALAKEREQPQLALQLAVEILHQAGSTNHTDSRRHVDDTLYVSFFTVCKELCQNGSLDSSVRVQSLKTAFGQCQQAGMVSKRVLAAVRHCVSMDVRMNTIIGWNDTNSLPKEWSRNIPRRHRP